MNDQDHEHDQDMDQDNDNNDLDGPVDGPPTPFIAPEDSEAWSRHLHPDDVPLIALISKIADTDPEAAWKLLAKLLGYTGDHDRVVTPAGSRAYRYSAHSTPRLDAAIARAQSQITNAEPNRTNTHLKTSYADLAAVYNACRRACAEAGLAVTQALWPKKNYIVITTRLAHDGEWVECDFPVQAERQPGVNSKQAVGIAITYGRRYAVTSLLGIAAGEDTDGEDSSEPSRPSETAANVSQRWRQVVEQGKKVGVQPQELLRHVNKTNVSELTNSDLTKLTALIRSRGEESNG